MKSYSCFATIAALIFITACSSGGSGDGGRKVVVFSSGIMKADATDKSVITLEPGNRHEELELTLTADQKKVTVKTPAGDKTYDLPDNGVYLLNLKSDTIIGSMVNFGASQQRTAIDTEELDHMIDSTQQLMNGQNASDEKKTYFLQPNAVKKITTNMSATILSPYKNIPYEVNVDESGKAPEYYKFFTNKQKREALKELIDRLKK